MAYRNIDTQFLKSPFVRGLKAPLKLLYIHIMCDCTGAGIWTEDFEIASIYTGEKLTKKDFETHFVNQNKAIDLGCGKYFFPDFIQHQYPKGLSRNNPAQKNFIKELEKYKLVDDNLNVVITGVQKGLQSPLEASHVTVTVNVPVNVRKGGMGEKQKKEIPTIEEFMHVAKTNQLFKPSLEYSLIAKYNAWLDAGWKDGNGKEIKNWKSKLNVVFPYLKEVATTNNDKLSSNRSVVNSVLNNIITNEH